VKRCSPLLVLTLLALSACGGKGDRELETLSRERFIAANVALRTARFPHLPIPATAADSAKARADSARIRAEVLKREKVTAREMQAFLEARRRDTEELAEIWKEIAEGVAKADSVARADSLRRDSLAQRRPGVGLRPELATAPGSSLSSHREEDP
jgi:hypothetical protein